MFTIELSKISVEWAKAFHDKAVTVLFEYELSEELIRSKKEAFSYLQVEQLDLPSWGDDCMQEDKIVAMIETIGEGLGARIKDLSLIWRSVQPGSPLMKYAEAIFQNFPNLQALQWSMYIATDESVEYILKHYGTQLKKLSIVNYWARYLESQKEYEALSDKIIDFIINHQKHLETIVLDGPNFTEPSLKRLRKSFPKGTVMQFSEKAQFISRRQWGIE